MTARWVVRGVALVGVLLAVVLSVSGGARRRVVEAQLVREVALQRAARTARSHVRPLDQSVRGQPLDNELVRRVLGLYNGKDPDTDAEANHVHLKAELILNHLGLLVDLRDVNRPLPEDEAMSRYLGVLAWFDGQRMKQPLAYLKWLARQAQAGRRVVVLGGLGASVDLKGRQTTPEELNEALSAIGLEYHGDFTNDPHRIVVVSKDSEMVEFERKLPRRLEFFEHYRLTDPAGRAYLRLGRADKPEVKSDVVVVTPRGGFVAPSYVMEEERFGRNYVTQWRIDPFRFFAEAFGVQRTPRPDFTTLNGSRIYYSHIDGDGFPSITAVDYKSMCGDFARVELLEAFDLPTTVSFVVGEIAPPPRGIGTKERVAGARKIAALPQVELAAHGLCHPMDWRARQHAVCAVELPGYRMDPREEIVGASRWITDNLAPAGKSTRVMLWTGWCNPAEDMLQLAEKEGLYNLNGGDPVMTGEFPSYLHLAPPIHHVGKVQQYYTSAPNEYILTEEWQPPFHRWRKVIEVMRNTDVPRRVYPMNVYYHFYIVENEPGLAAMKDVLRWVLRQEPAPLFASEYLDVMRDFQHLRLAAVEPGSDEAWRVLNSGYDRTIRFDRADRHVDMERSKGVIGYRRLPRQGALYVHLDESHDHTVVLSPTIGRAPFVLRVAAYADKVKLSPRRATMTLRGFGRKYVSLANMSPSSWYLVRARNEEGREVSGRVHSGSVGTLHWNGDINGNAIDLSIVRAEGS
jgi:hypothetical protein